MAVARPDMRNSRQVQIIAVNSVLIFLSITAVILRFWARSIQRISFYADDFLIVIALWLALGVNALLYYSLYVGVGRHEDQLSGKTVEAYALNLFIMQVFWNMTLPVIKVSILLFLMRMFPTRTMRYACNSVIVFLVLWYVAFQTVAIFQCQPIHHQWQKKTTKGHCINFVPFVTTLAATNLATDVVLLILPVREIWNLQMRRMTKIGLIGVFALGILICAIAIVRLDSLASISEVDITWSDAYAHLWTAIESSLGVVVACLPHLMPVYRRMRGQTMSKSYDRSPAANRGAWISQQNERFGRSGSQQLYTVSATNGHKFSGKSTASRRGSDDFDLLSKYSIGVTTEIERHAGPAHPGKHDDAYHTDSL